MNQVYVCPYDFNMDHRRPSVSVLRRTLKYSMNEEEMSAMLMLDHRKDLPTSCIHMDDLPILIVLIMKNSFYSERYSGDPVHSILFNNVKVILKQTLGNLFLHELIYCYK